MGTLDQATLAGLLALAIGLVKIIELLISQIVKKFQNEKGESNGHDKFMIVQMDPESSRMIRETAANTKEVRDVISRADASGSPLVYTPPEIIKNQKEILERVKDISTTQNVMVLDFTKHDERSIRNYDLLENVMEEVKLINKK